MAQIKIKGILSYPHLFQPRAVNPGDEPKYSVAIMIRKDDLQLTKIQQVIETEKANGFPSGFPSTGNICLKDGAIDANFSNDTKYHDFMILNANNKDKPQVVDMNLQPLLDAAQVYAGCIAWISVGIQAYSMPVNKGVGCYVNGVMPTGEESELGRIDGRPTVSQMFGDVSNGTITSPPASPPASLTMTATANGMTYEAYQKKGWTDEQLIASGMAK